MIVLTGGAGFIGSCLLSRFNALGRKDIIVVDHVLDDLKKENLKGKKFYEYCDKSDFLKNVLKGRINPKVDCVIHMGACSSTILQDEKYFEENNFQYTLKLAQWSLPRGVRFIYASSAATYGDGSKGYSDADSATRQCRPLNLYGKSKQKFDLWVLDNGVIDRLVGLKFFNVFGPNEYHKGEMRSVIAKAYSRAAQEGRMALFKSYKKEFADGEQKRDFIYIKDAVDVVMFFFDKNDRHGIYNVGTGKARSWNDVARALFRAVGKPADIEYIEMPEAMRGQYQYFTQAEMAKLKAAGFIKPFTELEDAIGDYAQYLKKHAYL